MLVIIIALVTGFIAGCLLDRLTSRIVLYINRKEASAEIGAITCPPVSQDSSGNPFSENTVSGFWDTYHCPSVNYVPDGSAYKRTACIAMISSLLTGLTIWQYGVTFPGLAASVCLCFLIVLGLTDSRTGYLPDCLTYPFLWMGLLVNIKTAFVPLDIAVISAVVAWLICCASNALFRLVAGNDGLGRGDFKMIAALGAWFGWESLILVVIMASLLAIVSGVTRMLKGRLGFEQNFPFGPYLAIAAVPVLLFGSLLMQTLNDFS